MNVLKRCRRTTQVRLFACPVCGARKPATKRAGRKTEAGHIKTMWCFCCREERDFEQVA